MVFSDFRPVEIQESVGLPINGPGVLLVTQGVKLAPDRIHLGLGQVFINHFQLVVGLVKAIPAPGGSSLGGEGSPARVWDNSGPL